MFNTIRYLLLPVLNASGPVFIWLAAALLIPFTLSVSKQDGAADSFLTCFLITLATGVVLMLLTRRWRRELTSRHGFLLVTLIWTSVPLFGTIPFIIERPDMSFAQLYFEMMSCLTTTGATVFTGLDKLPVSLNGWRCFLSWIGGMGLIVLSVAILPLLGVGGSQIIKAETTGPLKEHRLTPRIADTAKALYIIYLGVSVACAISYHLAGMEWEDAIMHMMTTVSLSGIGTHDASFAYFNSPAVDAVAIVFMLISGFNFSLHFMVWRRRNFLIYLQDAEAKAWIATAALMSALTIIVLADAHVYETSAETVRHALFSVVSVITTTGFGTADFAKWPEFSKTVLLILMAIGACAGSTGGGMKVSRVLILAKTARAETRHLLHPHSVEVMTMDGKRVSSEVIRGTMAFFICYAAIAVVSILLVSLDNFGAETSVTSVFATLNNIGPGLSLEVGPFGSYASFSALSKVVLTLDMLLGRLELFPVLLLLSPATWRKH